MSLNNSSPKKADVVATSGAGENELDKLTLLTFDVKAEKDDVTITDIAVAVAKSGTGGATASTTVYLFEGSTELDNTTIGGNTAIFTDFDYVVPKDTTKTLTVKADIRNANGTVSYFTASASTTGTSALVTENSDGDSVTESGSATGYAIGVRNAGPVVTLTSKSITTTGVQVGGTSPSTSTMTAKFNLKIVATGGAVTFGTVASGTPAFASSTSGFLVYVNGASASTFLGYGTSTSWTFPSACSTSGLNNSCTLSEGNSMDVEVSFLTQGRTTNSTAVASGLYSVGMEGVAYRDAAGTAYTLNFMSGESDWRTGEISFP
jgi:hypothetical protein